MLSRKRSVYVIVYVMFVNKTNNNILYIGILNNDIICKGRSI
jgi:hypothetical protein